LINNKITRENNIMKKLVLILLIAVGSAGCANTVNDASLRADPADEYYSGNDYNRVVAQCQNLANRHIESSNRDIAGNAALGALGGAVVGGIINPSSDIIGRGAVIGGAIGGTGAALATKAQRDRERNRLVNQCLRNRGYNPLY
jgi:outer membrane lipoprotein SlyB